MTALTAVHSHLTYYVEQRDHMRTSDILHSRTILSAGRAPDGKKHTYCTAVLSYCKHIIVSADQEPNGKTHT